MTDPIRLYRLWRTSGIMCAMGALEFAYLAWMRQAWWPILPALGLAIASGFAFRRAKQGRTTP